MHDEERVRERAYKIWEEAGRPDGQHDAHWQQARREIEAEGSEAPRPEPSGKTSTNA